MAGQKKRVVGKTKGMLDRQIKAQRQRIRKTEVLLRQHRETLAALEGSRRVLDRKPRVRIAPEERTALQRAGRGNVHRALALLQRKGPMVKADITRAMKINDGTVTYALRHLEEEGLVRKTGNRVHGSNEYVCVSRRAVTRPGGR